MIINEAFICQAIRAKCYVDNDGNIKAYPFSSDNLMLSYNPFKESKELGVSLYGIFADLKTDNDILKFIENYGFPGLHFEPFVGKNWLEFVTASVKHDSFYKDYSENIDAVKKEISLMDAILELISEFKSNTELQKEMFKDIPKNSTTKDRSEKVAEVDAHTDYKPLTDKIDNVYKYNGRSIEIDNLTDHHPRLIAEDLIIKELETKLLHVNMRLSYSASQGGFIENRYVHNLLTAMYLMLYEDLTTSKRFSRCKNRTCNKWFTIDTRHKKKYCSQECEQAEKQRRYREKLKKESE